MKNCFGIYSKRDRTEEVVLKYSMDMKSLPIVKARRSRNPGSPRREPNVHNSCFKFTIRKRAVLRIP